MVDNFDFKVTPNDLGFNFFSGNMGAINQPAPAAGEEPIVDVSWSSFSAGTVGGSWLFEFDFTGYRTDSFCGGFLSLFGLTDTLVELEGTGVQPSKTTSFANYYVDFDNFYGAFKPWSGRTIEGVAFETRLSSGSPGLTLKVELRDEFGNDVFVRLNHRAANWATAWLPRDLFNRSTRGSPALFRWDRVSLMSLIVERRHVSDGIDNPVQGGFYVDNIRLVDTNGLYPDLLAARDPANGALRPHYRDAFLDHVRKLSFLYFLDFASTDSRTGGMIQDRGTFADLMSVGGVGFQLTAYVIGAQRGYITREEAAARVAAILGVLDTGPQGAQRAGTTGYKGFFYHFFGVNGLRKQNFDFTATAGANESLNTVELSSIDTALALMGVITAKQYFLGADPAEAALRDAADRIVRRVEWPLLLATLADGKKQMCLGWKPAEPRDHSLGRFLLPDGTGTGYFSSKVGADGKEVAATLDYYTDEALLIALLGMAAPSEPNRLPRAVWDDIIRAGDGFVKTYPGALFTYQFLSCWADTASLGTDNHPERPVNFFDNTQQAIQATRLYAVTNAVPNPGVGSNAWGFSACEGPFDDYAAEGAPNAALASSASIHVAQGGVLYEGENANGSGVVMQRGSASQSETRYVTQAGQSMWWALEVTTNTLSDIVLQYSNDGGADELAVSMDGVEVGRIRTDSTGGWGYGWNVFEQVTVTNGFALSSGNHTLVVSVVTCDSYGVEVDYVRLASSDLVRPLDTGTLTAYGAGCSVVHLPDESVAALWHAAMLDLNRDGVPDLLHPRFGFADAFNSEIASARSAPGQAAFRNTGPWANMTGFAIDQGPLLLMLDRALDGPFVPRLFMSDTNIHRVLRLLFPAAADLPSGLKPVVTARSPLADPLFVAPGGKARFRIVATDDLDPDAEARGMVSVTWTVDGVFRQLASVGAPGTLTSEMTYTFGTTLGPVTVRALAEDRQGERTETVWNVVVTDSVLPPELDMTVGQAFGLALPAAFSAVGGITVKNLPPGLKYNASARVIEGVPTKPGTYSVVISATGVTPQTLTFTVGALPTWAQGAFNGYIQGGGLATMTVTALGKISGKLVMAGTNYTFSAKSFAAEGDEDVGFKIEAVAKASRASYAFGLLLAPASGGSGLSCAQGALLIPFPPDPDIFGMRPITLWRDAWKSEAAALAPYIGYYTATLPGGDACGSGYLTFTVDKAGKVKVGGRLADGTAVSLGGTLLLDEAGRVFAAVYTSPAAYKGGCLFGLAEFVDPAAGEVYLRLLDNVPFLWQSRSPQATGTFGAGFAYAPGLAGGWYSKTANLAAYYAGKSLSAGVDPDAATPELAVGAVRYDAVWWDPTGIALTPTLKLGVMSGLAAPAAGKPTDADKDGVWDYSPANSVGLKIALTRATGVFKGSFLAWFDYPVKKHASKSLAFEGALTPVRENMDDGVEGRGFFLWPDTAVPPLPAKPYAFKWSYDFLIRSE